MRTVTTTVKVFKYSELNQAAKNMAYTTWCDTQDDPTEFSRGDMIDSLHAAATLITGSPGKDWSIGCYNQNYRYRIDFDDDDHMVSMMGSGTKELARRMAWWENNVLTPNRIKPGIQRFHVCKYPRSAVNGKYVPGWVDRLGHVKECFLTGMCYDITVLEAIRTAIVVDGVSMASAFNHAAYIACKQLEEEHEYLTSLEYFESEVAGEEEYYEDGEVYCG